MKIKQPDVNRHFWISMIKSATRIIGYLMLIVDFRVGIGVLIASETIGILEEIL